jgi:ubiquinone/menaquinone biosynthesis C-methylase UbiE
MAGLHPAFETWDDAAESLESVERRIHDGVALDQLRQRARGYVETMYSLFPQAQPKAADTVCEIGSGVGYIMEAVRERCHPARIIGLDVAPAMIEHARARLARDGVDATGMEFECYDGVTLPFADRSIEHFYSVACLQHVPKIYVYNLFGEILRVLRNGYAVLQFLSFAHIPEQNRSTMPFRREIRRQINGVSGHWHHFYSLDELIAVLADGYGAQGTAVRQVGGAIWAVFHNRQTQPGAVAGPVQG